MRIMLPSFAELTQRCDWAPNGNNSRDTLGAKKRTKNKYTKGGHEKDQRGYGRDQKGYGKDQKGYGKDQKGYGKDQKGYGKDQKGYGRDQKGYEKGYENNNIDNYSSTKHDNDSSTKYDNDSSTKYNYKSYIKIDHANINNPTHTKKQCRKTTQDLISPGKGAYQYDLGRHHFGYGQQSGHHQYGHNQYGHHGQYGYIFGETFNTTLLPIYDGLHSKTIPRYNPTLLQALPQKESNRICKENMDESVSKSIVPNMAQSNGVPTKPTPPTPFDSLPLSQPPLQSTFCYPYESPDVGSDFLLMAAKQTPKSPLKIGFHRRSQSDGIPPKPNVDMGAIVTAKRLVSEIHEILGENPGTGRSTRLLRRIERVMAVLEQVRNNQQVRQNNVPPGTLCDQCGQRETPEWRRGPRGLRTLCNACGLFYSKLVRRVGPLEAAKEMAERRDAGIGFDRRI